MIDGLKPYPAYKDSGVPWLGQVPEAWKIVPLKRLARFKSGSGFPVSEQGYKRGDIPFLRVSDMNQLGNEEWIEVFDSTVTTETAKRLGAFVFPAGTIIFPKVGGALLTNKRRRLGRASCVDNNIMGCIVHAADADFAFVLLKQLDLARLAKPGPVPAISEGDVREILITLPPLPEQTAIVRFLDYIDRRVRRCIRAKQKLINLLEEYKQALIHQVVTGRIDIRTGQPYSAYKDSGVEWLGQVPEHWEVRRLKNITHIIMGQSPPSDDCSQEPIGIPFLQGCAEFGPKHPRAKLFCRRPMKVSPVGSILLSVRAPVGRLNVADQAYGLGRGLCAIVTAESLLDKNLGRYALSASTDGLTMSSTGSTYDAVSVLDIGNHRLPLPPLPEQTAIVEFLDEQTERVDTAIAATRRQIELLREYRTRLIADVVTGKVDVREVAARLSEEPAEEEAELEDTEETAEGEAADNEAAAETISEEEVEP